MKKILIIIGSVITLGLPVYIYAASPKIDGYLGDLFEQGLNLFRIIVMFLISLAVVWFIWNVIQHTISDDEDKRSKAKEQMIWGIVGITVMMSVWGIVAILQTAFGIGGSNTVPTNLNFIPGVLQPTTPSNNNFPSSPGSIMTPQTPPSSIPAGQLPEQVQLNISPTPTPSSIQLPNSLELNPGGDF